MCVCAGVCACLCLIDCQYDIRTLLLSNNICKKQNREECMRCVCVWEEGGRSGGYVSAHVHAPPVLDAANMSVYSYPVII